MAVLAVNPPRSGLSVQTQLLLLYGRGCRGSGKEGRDKRVLMNKVISSFEFLSRESIGCDIHLSVLRRRGRSSLCAVLGCDEVWGAWLGPGLASPAADCAVGLAPEQARAPRGEVLHGPEVRRWSRVLLSLLGVRRGKGTEAGWRRQNWE